MLNKLRVKLHSLNEQEKAYILYYVSLGHWDTDLIPKGAPVTTRPADNSVYGNQQEMRKQDTGILDSVLLLKVTKYPL